MPVFSPGSWLFRTNVKGRCRWNVVRSISGLSAYFLRYEHPIYLFIEELHQFQNASFCDALSFDMDDPVLAKFWEKGT
jgi:hypothetical protein